MKICSSSSVVGTSALVAAAQFEDIPDEKESLPPLPGAEPPPPGSAAATRQLEQNRRRHRRGRRRSRRGSRLSQGSSRRGSSRGSRSGSNDSRSGSSRSGSSYSGSYSGSSSDGSDGHSGVDSIARSEDDLAKSGPMVAVPGHRGIRRGGRSVAAALIAMGAEVGFPYYRDSISDFPTTGSSPTLFPFLLYSHWNDYLGAFLLGLLRIELCLFLFSCVH